MIAVTRCRPVELLRKLIVPGLLCLFLFGTTAFAAELELASDTNAALMPMGMKVQFSGASSPGEVSRSIQIILLLTMLSLAPSAIIMTTSFTRILIVLGFLRQAMGTQQTPPSQILAGMALFLTIFIMAPVWQKIDTDALQPYMAEQITQQEAWDRGVAPLRAFMEKQVGQSELGLFMDLSDSKKDPKTKEIPLIALIPAFMISELKIAFQLGFLIYLPFLLIDLVIAASLMSLGMMMLPPMMVSLPLKILFFVLADGWTILIRGVVSSFSI